MQSLSPRILLVITLTLWFGVLASAAGAIYSKHRARELFVELERLNSKRDTLESDASVHTETLARTV